MSEPVTITIKKHMLEYELVKIVIIASALSDMGHDALSTELISITENLKSKEIRG